MSTTSDKEARATDSVVVERDDRFYFEDDPMAIFLVEDKLFKVHRHFFIQGSQIFRDMFSVGDAKEGKTDEEPIVLSNVTRNEFQTLLRFFYSLSSRVLETGSKVFPSISQFTQDEKISLLSISHRFLFDDIFNLIKSQVPATSLSIVTRIRLGDKYNMTEWLSSAYVDLLDRNPDDLSAEEAEALGFERLTCLYKAKCSMYQERVPKKADESATCSNMTNWATQRKEKKPSWASDTWFNEDRNFGSSTVGSEKTLTPTIDVVRKFFKLK